MVQRYEQKRRLQWYKRGAAYACFSNDILQSRCPRPNLEKSANKLVRNELLTLKMLDISESELAAIFTEDDFKADYRILNREVRKLGYNIPPLVNAYMSLSPTMKLFGTAINYGFGDVEETGILIAIDEILEEKRVRHINSFIDEHPEALKITSGANNVIYKEKDI